MKWLKQFFCIPHRWQFVERVVVPCGGGAARRRCDRCDAEQVVWVSTTQALRWAKGRNEG